MAAPTTAVTARSMPTALRQHLSEWAGSLPADDQVLVVPNPRNEAAGWDGRPSLLTDPAGRTVVAVPPAVAARATAILASRPHHGLQLLPGLVGQPGRAVERVTFRWTVRPAQLPEAGVWVDTTSARLPGWLRPFGGQASPGASSRRPPGTSSTTAASRPTCTPSTTSPPPASRPRSHPEPGRCPRGRHVVVRKGPAMSVTRIAVVVLIAAVLAGCAVGDGPARQDAYPAPGGAPTEQTRSRALQRAGDLPAGYDTLDREVLTASDRDWGDPWGDEGWGDPFTAQAAIAELADLADRCRTWRGDGGNDVRGGIDVTTLPAPDGVDDATALRVSATADAGLTVTLTSDVVAVRRGAAVAVVTYTRFDARRADLRLGPLVATAAARLATLS